MNSRLYSCKVVHNRIRPRKHAFSYRIFMFALDLDELDEVASKLKLISRNRPNVYSFSDDDHWKEGKEDIKSNLKAYLSSQGVSETPGKITLVTHLRTFGHVFNPVSFYFIRSKDDQPICAVAEVANTFNEQKLYLIKAKDFQDDQFEEKLAKEFYVSPYSDLDTEFDFSLREPSRKLAISINQSKDGETYFFSSLVGEERELTDWNLLKYTCRFPLITLQIVLGIHWQALLLYFKGLRVRPKAANPELQTDKRIYIQKRHHQFRTLTDRQLKNELNI